MSIQYTVPDSNPRPLERESPPITLDQGSRPQIAFLFRKKVGSFGKQIIFIN